VLRPLGWRHWLARMPCRGESGGLLDALAARVGALGTGDPLEDGPLPGDVNERCVTFLSDGRNWSDELPLSSPRGDVTLFAVSGAAVFSVTRLVGDRPGTLAATPAVTAELVWSGRSRMADGGLPVSLMACVPAAYR